MKMNIPGKQFSIILKKNSMIAIKEKMNHPRNSVMTFAFAQMMNIIYFVRVAFDETPGTGKTWSQIL